MKTEKQSGKYSVGVGGVVVCDGRILLVRKKTGPYSGIWSLPGGYIEYNEMIDQAIIREIKEETGVNAIAHEIILIRQKILRDKGENSLYIVFRMSTRDLNPKADGIEIKEARYFHRDDIVSLDPMLPLCRLAVKKIFNNDGGFNRLEYPDLPEQDYMVYG